MEVNRQHERSCLQKRPYDSNRKAKNALQRLKRNIRQQEPGRSVEFLGIYPCPYCSLWHIGNNHKQRLRKERR